MRVVISGGGTGGHIYPALAIVNEIKRQEPHSSLLFVGNKGGMEEKIVAREHIPFFPIHIRGFRRRISFQNIHTVYLFLKSVRQVKQKLKQFKPDIVIGTGGYVSGPVVFAASRLGIPTLVHEQNVVPGLTNAFLSRYSTGVAVSFADSETYFKHSNVRVTGNPRASEVLVANGKEGRRSLNIPNHKQMVLIVGGSQGSQAINTAFQEMMSAADLPSSAHFVYVTGPTHYEQIRTEWEESKRKQPNVTIIPYIYNMPDVLATTDIIVNRAGASFLAEITALGIPAVLIPLPHATNNHQLKNARWLETNNAAKVIVENELNGKRLIETIKPLLANKQMLQEMGDASKRLGKQDAGQQIFSFIQSIRKEN